MARLNEFFGGLFEITALTDERLFKNTKEEKGDRSFLLIEQHTFR
jgi:hypothetical protein